MRGFFSALYSVAVTVWVGSMLAIGYLAAPVLFAQLSDRGLAGNLAGAMFTYTAWIGMGCGAYLLLYLLGAKGWRAIQSGVFWIVVLMLALTAAGLLSACSRLLAQLKADALPRQVMESALRSRFATWHGVSSVLYLVQSLLGSCTGGAAGARQGPLALLAARFAACGSLLLGRRFRLAPCRRRRLFDGVVSFGILAPQHQQVADVLNLGTVERRAYLEEQCLAHFPLDAVESQLDQFVGLEATVDLGQHGRRQALLADGDDWFQMVRGGPQGAALGGGDIDHGGIVA
jgi:hypothetical protein